MGQKWDFPEIQIWPFSAFLGPPGPRDPENRIRHDLLYNLVVFRAFLVAPDPFPGHFSIFTSNKHSPKTRPNKAPRASGEPPKAAPRTPGPLGTPPGTIRKVVPENAQLCVLGAPGWAGRQGLGCQTHVALLTDPRHSICFLTTIWLLFLHHNKNLIFYYYIFINIYIYHISYNIIISWIYRFYIISYDNIIKLKYHYIIISWYTNTTIFKYSNMIMLNYHNLIII